MRLRLVTEADFRRSEVANFEVIQKKEQLRLGDDDVICLVSQSKNQVMFVWRPLNITIPSGETTIVRSMRLRLTRSTFNPLMLANYATAVGLQLDGLRRFEDILGRLRETAPLKRAA